MATNPTTVNVVSDLCTYAKLPHKILDDIVKKLNLCIGSALYESKMSQNSAVVLNIGVGTLSIELATGQCKFMPSRDLKSIIKKCMDSGIDPLQIELEEAIREKLLNIYKNEV